MGRSQRSGRLLSAAFEIEIIKALKNIQQGTNICDKNRGEREERVLFPQQSLYREVDKQQFLLFLGIPLPRSQTD